MPRSGSRWTTTTRSHLRRRGDRRLHFASTLVTPRRLRHRVRMDRRPRGRSSSSAPWPWSLSARCCSSWWRSPRSPSGPTSSREATTVSRSCAPRTAGVGEPPRCAGPPECVRPSPPPWPPSAVRRRRGRQHSASGRHHHQYRSLTRTRSRLDRATSPAALDQSRDARIGLDPVGTIFGRDQSTCSKALTRRPASIPRAST